MTNLEVACLVFGLGLLYGVTRFIGDFRKRDVTPPMDHDGSFDLAERVRWDKVQTIKWLVALIVGTVIVMLIAKYYPGYIPQPSKPPGIQ